MVKNKIYHNVSVGSFGITSGDDTVEIDLPLSEEEVNAIVTGCIKLIGVVNAIDWDEAMESFAPEAFHRAIRLADEKKDGAFSKCLKEKYLVSVFLPDQLCDMILDSEKAKELDRTRKTYERKSNKRWKEDYALLKKQYKNGRWADELSSKKEQFEGAWTGDGENYYYIYSLDIETSSGRRISYEKVYAYNEKRIIMRFYFYDIDIDFMKKFCLENQAFYPNPLKVEEISWYGRIITDTDNCDTGVKFFMRLLDYITEKKL